MGREGTQEGGPKGQQAGWQAQAEPSPTKVGAGRGGVLLLGMAHTIGHMGQNQKGYQTWQNTGQLAVKNKGKWGQGLGPGEGRSWEVAGTGMGIHTKKVG